MAGEPDLTKVLDSIYFAPHGGSGWCDCLNLICELVRGDAARLLRIDKQTEQVVAELPGKQVIRIFRVQIVAHSMAVSSRMAWWSS